MTDKVLGDGDAKELAVYQGLADRVTRLEELGNRVTRLEATTETHATREWVYQKAFAVIVGVATVASAAGTALVAALWGL